MNATLLGKIFGREQRWVGPCTVVLDAEAMLQALGMDRIVGGGAKSYAPRMVSGRIHADAACLLQDGSAVVMVFQLEQQKSWHGARESKLEQSLIIADATRVVAVEFPDTNPLAGLGVTTVDQATR
jgi:hypothetical protein